MYSVKNLNILGWGAKLVGFDERAEYSLVRKGSRQRS
jgi:hypothetical protein